MKTTLKELLSIKRGLEEFGQVKLLEDTKTSYRLAKLRRDIGAEMELLEKVRKDLIERLSGGRKNESGQPDLDAEGQNVFATEMEKLLGQEIEVYWVPIAYDTFNPKNRLKLIEDFVYLTFPLWTEPSDEAPREN